MSADMSRRSSAHTYVAEEAQAVEYPWGLRNIKWSLVFWYQDYGAIMVATVAFALFLRESVVGFPVERAVIIYDATISLPKVKSDALESWQAALLPLSFLFLTMTWIEFGVFRYSHSITKACIAYGHFILSALSSWTCSVWITSFFKNFAGRLRPDFLARCKPEESRDWDAYLTYGKSVNVTCTNPNLEKLRHGHFSFPSQHSCWAMTAAWYSLMYVSWTLYLRYDNALLLGRFRETGWRRIRREMVAALGLIAILGQIFFVWHLGVVRFRQNRHNISDIVGGWFMGLVVSTMFALRAIYIYDALRKEIPKVEMEMAMRDGVEGLPYAANSASNGQQAEQQQPLLA